MAKCDTVGGQITNNTEPPVINKGGQPVPETGLNIRRVLSCLTL